MHTAKKGGLTFMGMRLEETREVVALNKRERAAIKRAASVVSELRAARNPDGLEDGGTNIAALETHLLDMVERAEVGVLS